MSDKPTVSLESGVSYYRASSISLPPRCLAAGRIGYEQMAPPYPLQAAFNAGHKWEGSIIRRSASNLGMKVVSELDGTQYECVIPVGSRAAIRGHIDAIFEDENGVRYGFEAKALGPDWSNTIKRRGIEGVQHYCDQLSVYWAGFPFLRWYFGVQEKEFPEQDPFIITVDAPPCDINILKAKVAMVEAGVRAGKELDDFEYYSHGWCAFSYLHPDKEDSDAPITTNQMLDTLSRTYSDARDEEKQAKAKMTAVRDQIIHAMGDQKRIDTTQFSVKVETVTTRRFNQKAAEDEMGVEWVEKFKLPSEYTKVTVKGRSE